MKVVIATIGSLGDLHPCLAVGRELATRGYTVTVATTPYYKQVVEGVGLEFRPMRPDWDPTDRRLIASCEDLKNGLEVLYREMLLPELRNTYEDLLAVVKSADLMIAGELVYAAPLVAEKLSIRWASLILSPFSFFSCIDPPVTPNLPNLVHLRKWGAGAYRAGLALGKLATRHWSNPVRRLRRTEGLRRSCDPVFRDKFSPDLVLALFSPSFASKKPDWPEQAVQPGFVSLETPPEPAAVSKLTDFLSGGTAPAVFTRGSTAVHNPGDFYRISAAAAKRLGLRAVLIGTTEAQNGADVLSLPYVPYSHVFPHAAVNVHQGGSGTTGDALKAGRPMLVVPYGWDQPDNAARIERLGVGLQLATRNYTVENVTAAIETLVSNSHFADRCQELRERQSLEDGLKGACDAIESLFSKSPASSN